MTRSIWIILVLSFWLLTACGASGARTRDSASRAEQQLARDRAQIIDKLLPDDRPTQRRKLNTIIEAITAVSNVPNRDIPENALGVRQVLSQRSLRDLRRIESIVMEAERKREDDRSE
jgi:hypothetical protein